MKIAKQRRKRQVTGPLCREQDLPRRELQRPATRDTIKARQRVKVKTMADQPRDWNQRYAAGDTPWESGQPSAELMRVLAEWKIGPCRVLEMGCGTGENAASLARQGFDVTAFDLVPLAIERAEAKIRAAGVKVRL